ncbi:hypothetical protein J4458_07330 [Candidatus Woesearchaeota archaeon]|nr:hypothetical protein [Candidatus Woesearchaeota archaeon]
MKIIKCNKCGFSIEENEIIKRRLKAEYIDKSAFDAKLCPNPKCGASLAFIEVTNRLEDA